MWTLRRRCWLGILNHETPEPLNRGSYNGTLNPGTGVSSAFDVRGLPSAM